MTDFQADHSLELECERKWLISKKIPYDLNSIKSVKIQQRYFKNTENKTQRIRLIDDKTYILNRKVFQKGVLGAVEMEKKITKKEAEELLKHAIPNQMGGLRKTRYYIPYGEYTIELDCFDELLDNLIFAEVEFKSLVQMAMFKKPSRFGKEITGIVSNKDLYIHGLQAIKTTKRIRKHKHEDLEKMQIHLDKAKSSLLKLKKKL